MVTQSLGYSPVTPETIHVISNYSCILAGPKGIQLDLYNLLEL